MYLPHAVDITGEPRNHVPRTRLVGFVVPTTNFVTVDIHQFAARFFTQAKARAVRAGLYGVERNVRRIADQSESAADDGRVVRRLEPYDRRGGILQIALVVTKA
jgi:hypothetical protein